MHDACGRARRWRRGGVDGAIARTGARGRRVPQTGVKAWPGQAGPCAHAPLRASAKCALAFAPRDAVPWCSPYAPAGTYQELPSIILHRPPLFQPPPAPLSRQRSRLAHVTHLIRARLVQVRLRGLAHEGCVEGREGAAGCGGLRRAAAGCGLVWEWEGRAKCAAAAGRSWVWGRWALGGWVVGCWGRERARQCGGGRVPRGGCIP